jgi:hypothetical protein
VTGEEDAAVVASREDDRWAALLAGDVDRLDDLLHDRLGYGHSSGARDSKADLIGKVADGSLRYLRVDREVLDTVVVGDTALLVASMSADIELAGRPVALESVTLSVWVRAADGWRLLAFQPTPRPPGA